MLPSPLPRQRPHCARKSGAAANSAKGWRGGGADTVVPDIASTANFVAAMPVTEADTGFVPLFRLLFHAFESRWGEVRHSVHFEGDVQVGPTTGTSTAHLT